MTARRELENGSPGYRPVTVERVVHRPCTPESGKHDEDNNFFMQHLNTI